jgi:tetratricopeptide (TPR) repeat protein
VHLVEEFNVEGDGYDPVLRKASRAILVVIDPVTLAMDDLWQGDLAAARKSIERALRATAGDQRQVAETLLGIRQLADGEAAEAERTLRAAIWRRTDFAPAHLVLARAVEQTRGADAARAVLADLDRHAAAGTWSERASREVPAAAAYVRARLAAAEGRWAEAVSELRRATEAAPTFAAAHEALAEAYLVRREAPFAEYHAQTALRLTAPDVPRFDDHLDHLLQLAVTPIRPRPGS